MSFLLAEQNTNMALRYATYGYILETGRVVHGRRGRDRLRENEDVKEFYLGVAGDGRKSFRDVKQLQAPQALAGVTSIPLRSVGRRDVHITEALRYVLAEARHARQRQATEMLMHDHYDALETRDPSARARDCARSRSIARAMTAPGWAKHLDGVDRSRHVARGAGASCRSCANPICRRCRRRDPPFGGFVAGPPGGFGRLFTSPGPIFEPEGRHDDPWRRGARAVRRGLPARATSCSIPSPIT